MSWFQHLCCRMRGFGLRLRFLLRRERAEREMDEELRFHLDRETEANLRAGMPPARARRQALLTFGGVERFKEQTREARGVGPVEGLLQDVRYAARQSLRSPLFTGVAVLTLALGIGANTAIFSLLNGLLLRDRPYQAPEALVHVYTSVEGESPYATSFARDLDDLRSLDDVFLEVGAFRGVASRIQQSEGARMVLVEAVSSNLFPLVGVAMALGRGFSAEEDEAPGAFPVAVLGHALWERRYEGDPGVLGRTIRLGGEPYTIVGVAPDLLESFTAQGFRTDLFIPLAMAGSLEGETDRERAAAERGSQGTKIIARLRTGVALEQAQARVDGLSLGLRSAHRELYEKRSFLLLPSRDIAIQPDLDAYLLGAGALLLAGVGLVLLLICTNLTSFLLARGVDRRREIALRLALGAGRGRLIRQLLTETLALSALGAAAGILLGRWALDLVSAARPTMSLPLAIDTRMDGTVLLFTVAVTTAAGLVAGLVPALQSTDPDVAPTLKAGSEAPGRPHLRLRNVLVGFQMAVSMVLLLAGGLVVKDAMKIQAVDPGFDTGEAALLWLDLELSGVPRGEWDALAEALAAEARALPGVERVAVSNAVQLSEAIWEAELTLPGVDPPPGQGFHRIHALGVDGRYLDVMGIPLVVGRGIGDQDREGAEGVVVVSEAAARRFWPDGSPLGEEVRTAREGESFRVVGVARDTKVLRPGEGPQPLFYLPRAQFQHRAGQLWLVVRGSAGAAEMVGALRRMVRERSSDLVVVEAKTMDEHLALALFLPRLTALVLGAFGILAVALAALGLYGVVSYSVSRRTPEVGIRLSLGASRAQVVRMLVRDALGVVTVGGAIGYAAALAAAPLLAPFLVGVSPRDLMTLSVVPLLLLGVAGLAALLPARRAGRVDPVRALRAE